jgi:hypothetical protein
MVLVERIFNCFGSTDVSVIRWLFDICPMFVVPRVSAVAIRIVVCRPPFAVPVLLLHKHKLTGEVFRARRLSFVT